jgi:hypothetical protein
MSDAAMEKILDSGSLEDIDALLSNLEKGMDESAALAAVESSETVPIVPDVEPVAPVDPPSQNVQSQVAPPAEADAPAAILAKDGKNLIPFSVLENTRHQAAAIQAQLEEAQRVNALLQGQLTEANIKPKELPEHIRFTPEQLEDFATYGEIGEAVAILAQQNQALQEQIARQIPSYQPPEMVAPESNPLANNPDTLRWSGNDAHWDMMQVVNSGLDSDPNWAGRDTAARVPEIVRRMKVALGESSGADVTASAQATIAAAQRVAPNSLTDVGGEVPGQTRPIADMLADGDAQDVEAYLAKATAGGKSMDEVLSALLG